MQRMGLPRVDRSLLPQCERIEASRLRPGVRHGGDQLHVLPGPVARHGPGLGPLYAGRIRLCGEGAADGHPRSAPRRGRGRGQRSPGVLRSHATALGPGKTRAFAPSAPPAPAVRRDGDPSVPRCPPAELHVRPRATQQIVDDDGGVRFAPVDRGRVHDRGRAAAPARPPRDLAVRILAVARTRDGPLVQLPLLGGGTEDLGPTSAAGGLPVGDHLRILQQPLHRLCARELHPNPAHARHPDPGSGAGAPTDRRVPQAGHTRRGPIEVSHPRGLRRRRPEGRARGRGPGSSHGPEPPRSGEADRLEGRRGHEGRPIDPGPRQGVPGGAGSVVEDHCPRLRGLGEASRAKGLLQTRGKVLPQPPEGGGALPPRCHRRRPRRVDIFDADRVEAQFDSPRRRVPAAKINDARDVSESVGVHLTPIVIRHPTTLEAFRGRAIAVDGNLELYQFLSIMRTRDGTPLQDSKGRITSHLNGLMFRTTRLMDEYDIRPLFVFDGRPPDIKQDEIRKRREAREKSEREYQAAIASGDTAKAWSKAIMTSRLTRPMVEEAKTLLGLLGLPWIQAPSEGEAQAAFLARRGDVWAAGSKDYDSLLFGAPRMVRFLAIGSTEFLPSLGRSRMVAPEILDLEENLGHLGLTREQLIDVAILVGTDFNEGVKGIGPKTALKRLHEWGSLDRSPPDVQAKLPANLQAIREFFLSPPVAEPEEIVTGRFRPEEVRKFLVDERDFAGSRVESVVQRLSKRRVVQPRLDDFSDARETIK